MEEAMKKYQDILVKADLESHVLIGQVIKQRYIIDKEFNELK